MKHLKIKEIICVVLLTVFIVFVLTSATGSNKSAQELAESVTAVMDMTGLVKRESEGFKKSFSLNVNDYSSVTYYSSDDIMNVSELLIVKLGNDEKQAAQTIAAVEAHATAQMNIFNGYGEEQSELLKSYVLKQSGNCILFVVSAQAQQASNAFFGAL